MKESKTQKRYTKALKLPNGTRKWFRASTQEELEQKVLEAQMLIAGGVDLSRHDTFGEVAQLWYSTYKKPYLRPNSLAAIQRTLNNHIMPVLAPMQMREIKPFHVQQVFARISGKSASLNNKVYQALDGIFALAVDNGLIVKSPLTSSVRRGGKKTQEKHALTREEQQQLLDAVRDTSAHLFVVLGLATGLRRGELLGLYWSDVDFKVACLHVRHNWTAPEHNQGVIDECLKTDAARRDVPVPPAVLELLRQARSTSNSVFVFHKQDGTIMSESGFFRLWQHTAKSGLTGMRNADKVIHWFLLSILRSPPGADCRTENNPPRITPSFHSRPARGNQADSPYPFLQKPRRVPPRQRSAAGRFLF